jgi:hypothetical protein
MVEHGLSVRWSLRHLAASAEKPAACAAQTAAASVALLRPLDRDLADLHRRNQPVAEGTEPACAELGFFRATPCVRAGGSKFRLRAVRN